MSNGFDQSPPTAPGRPAKNQRFLVMCVLGAIILTGLFVPSLLGIGQPPNQSTKATTTTETKAAPGTGDGASFAELISRLLLGTLGVCVLAGFGAYVFAKRAKKKVATRPGPLQVLGQMPVGRGVVYLVKVGEKKLLAGVDPRGFQTLMELPAKEMVPEMIVPEAASVAVEPQEPDPGVIISRRIKFMTEPNQ